MQKVKYVFILFLILVTMTACSSHEQSKYPTMAEIDQIFYNDAELFTKAAEILRGHKDFFQVVYDQHGQWRITSFDQEWILSYFSEEEIEVIQSVWQVVEPLQIKFIRFTVPDWTRDWSTKAPAIQFSYKIQDENGVVDIYDLCYVRADDTGTEDEKNEAVTLELDYLQRYSSVWSLGVDGWYGKKNNDTP